MKMVSIPMTNRLAEALVGAAIVEIAQHANRYLDPEVIGYEIADELHGTGHDDERLVKTASLLSSIAAEIMGHVEGEGVADAAPSSVASASAPPPAISDEEALERLEQHDPELAQMLRAFLDRDAETLLRASQELEKAQEAADAFEELMGKPLVILGNIGFEKKIGGES